MNLEQQLAELKTKMRTVIPPAVWDEMERQVDALRRSGLTERLPGVGDSAPTFTLPASTGESVSLEQLLARGPLVLSFYRGRW